MSHKTKANDQPNSPQEAGEPQRPHKGLRRAVAVLAIAAAGAGINVARNHQGGDSGEFRTTDNTEVPVAPAVQPTVPRQLQAPEQAPELPVEQQAEAESNQMAAAILQLAEANPEAAVTGDTSMVDEYGYPMTIIRADVTTGGNFTVVGKTLVNTDTDSAFPESPYTEFDVYYSVNPDGSLPEKPDSSVILERLPISEQASDPTAWRLITTNPEATYQVDLTTVDGAPNQLTPEALTTAMDPVDLVLSMITPDQLVKP